MTQYHPSYEARVRDLSFVGATEAEIARIFGVSVSTLRSWAERYPAFASAWEDGKIQADAKVAASLYQRAIGYKTTKWKETKDGMFQEQVVYPPDVNAQVFWLSNRRPELWKRNVDESASGKPVTPDMINDVEVARRIAYTLTKASNAIIEGETVPQQE